MARTLSLFLLLSAMGTVSALRESDMQAGGQAKVTHAEMCFPMVSGLITDVRKMVGFSNDSLLHEKRGAKGRGHSKGRPGHPLPGEPDELNSCGSPRNIMFRTLDGSCNHRFNKGQALDTINHLLPADYADGVGSPRQFSVLGTNQPLPSPRVVSKTVHPDQVKDSDLTIFVMQWGQFMDHEMVSTPLPIEDTRGLFNCCGPDAGPPTGQEDSECFPILFPSADPDFRGSCMHFVRSQAAVDDDGKKIVPRTQQNLITSFIDASTVYGSSEERLAELRDERKRFLLKTTDDNFPPGSGNDDCVKRDENDICFLAGDDRVNEQPALTLMHTLFVRYHNTLARSLRRTWPRMKDELVFQQARAIVWAVMQNILYSEWLPILLSPSVREKYGLDLKEGKFTRYDSEVDPSIFSAFSSAVFRFGHTLIPRSLPVAPGTRVPLREVFFKPFIMRENLDTLVNGLAQASNSEDRTQPPDQFIVEEVTKHLFENQEGERQGFDLVALNLQRGRDHGVPSYSAFREELGLRKVTSFADPQLGSAGADMATVYAHVDDIELFTGGISEPPFEGGLMGETFSTLAALQFQRLRYGDRFFFDNQRGPYGFSKSQVRSLRKIRLAHVLCETTGIDSVQRDVFRVPSASNPRVPCRTLKSEHPSLASFSLYPSREMSSRSSSKFFRIINNMA